METFYKASSQSNGRNYSLELSLLTAPIVARGRWGVTIQNGEWKKPKQEFSSVDEAIAFMLSIASPDVVDRAYQLMKENPKLTVQELYQQLGISQPAAEAISRVIGEKPDLGYYVQDKTLIPPEVQKKMISEWVV